MQVRFVTEQYDALPPKPDPRTIPIIHYGMRGRNDFEHYDSAYAVNTYNVSSRTLNARLQEFEPEAFRVRMTIVEAQHRTRSVALDQANVEDIDCTALGNLYLRKLEVEPALQVMGRVRYLTRPREVVFFALHDLSSEVPNLREVSVPGMLLRELDLPTAGQLDRYVDALRATQLRDKGLTADEVAAALSISRRSVFRLFEGAKSAKSHLRVLVGANWHDFDPIEVGGQAS
ncbi:MAG: hypothetical protein IPN34_17395 [Planctomycetes bacterium]|nr:hypothetical protein [Planctomycetota bacterium]